MTMTEIIEFILNYIFVPIFMILWGIWKLFSKLVRDVTGHIYGKILVPFIALLVVGYLLHFFVK